jgi:hypothetical protein
MKLSLINSSLFYSLLLAGSAYYVKADKCFNSTQAIVIAQAQDPPLKEFEICSDTTIEIGLPANAQFSDFVAGDFPISILHDDVTIKCGPDGKSSNNCVLKGGWVQFITTPNNPFLSNPITTNNLKVQGITFQGALTNIPGPGGNFRSTAVALGAPGMDMVFEDCIFDDLKADIFMYLLRDALTAPEGFPSMSASVTLKDSVIQDSTYFTDIISNTEQTFHLENVEFKDLTYELEKVELKDFTDDPCGCNTSSVIEIRNGITEMKDCTFENVEFLTSLVYVFGNDTEFTSMDNIGTGNTVFDKADRAAGLYCEEGLVVEKITNGMMDECVDLFAEEPTEDDDKKDAATTNFGVIGSIMSGIVAAMFLV